MDPERVELLDRIEDFFDTVPRDVTRAEVHGALVLFVREGVGWPFYARPAPGAPPAGPADITTVRHRQRSLGLPEAFEWIHEQNPELTGAARAAGLRVTEAPLLVLAPQEHPDPARHSPVPVRLLTGAEPELARDVATRRAVAAVGFSAAGTATGEAGPPQREAARDGLEVAALEEEAARIRTGALLGALAETPDQGALASGMAMRVGGVAEIAGVATLPAARRRGLGAAVTAALAVALRRTGTELVFLSAATPEVARVYQRVGFHRIGTACLAEPAEPDPTDTC